MSASVLRSLAPFLIVFLGAPTAADEYPTVDWPQWRGPKRDGVSSESGWLAQGRSDLWRKPVGMGYSSFVVAGGRLYTLGYDQEKEIDTIWCLDAASGEAIWTHSYPAVLLANFHGGGTLTTPALDGEVLYVSDRGGTLLCLNASSGAVLRSRDLVQEFGPVEMFHGYSGSPVVLEGKLIVTMGGKTIALDRTSGEVLWQTKNYGDGSYATPIDMTVGDRGCLAQFTGVGLAILDMADGRELALHPFTSERGGVNCATPIVIGSRVFISSAYDKGCAMLDILPEGPPAVLWESKVMRNKMTGCVLFKDHLYGFDESMLKCLDLEGNERWRVRGLGMGALMISGGRLIVMSSGGELIVADAAPQEYRELSRTKVLEGGVYWTTPVICGGWIYCRNSLGEVVARDHRPAAEPTAAAPRSGGAPGTGAAPAPAASGLPPAEALFAAHVQAIGGDAALRRHQSMRLSGTIDMPTEGATQTTLRIDRRAPDQELLTYSAGQFGTVTECYDGRIGWIMHPFNGNKLAEGAQLEEMRRHADFYAEADSKRTHESMETVGVSEFGGRRCYQVKSRLTGGVERFEYFDVANGLLAGSDGSSESMVVLDRYERFGDLLLPARRVVMEAGTGTQRTILITAVEFDAVEPSSFEPPEPIRWLLMTPEEIEAANAAAREKHAEYLGDYMANFQGFDNVPWTVTVSHGRLAVAVSTFGTYELDAPDESGRWRLSSIPAFAVSFDRDEAGAISAMHFYEPDAERVLPRKRE